MKERIDFGAKAFRLRQVTLSPGPFRDAFELNRNYLLHLDPERLLHTFRLNAGLPSDAEPYGGWEKPEGELRGHSLGHWLSGASMTAAACGDDALRQRVEYVVEELVKCQRALDAGGFLAAWPESFIDRAEASERVWAPYYTLHKIFAGLLDAHEHCGLQQALDVAVRFAEWVKRRTDRLDADHMQRMLDTTEQGGMNEAFCNLAAATGDGRWLETARRFDQQSYSEPLRRREDRLKGQHSNSFIPNVVGYAREYEMTGDEELRGAARFFWEQVARHRSYVTGGTSAHEHWGQEPDCMAGELSTTSHETCCSYNLLKLTRRLFLWRPEAALADYYERLLLNGVLATIDPKTGMTMYYVSMAPGYYKTYGTPENSFWCCTGTGMESHAKYGESIYFREPGDAGLFVNLFIASELDWPEKGLRLVQETRFPEAGTVRLTFRLERSAPLKLHLRVPEWAHGGATIRVAGETVLTAAEPGAYATIEREWADGDVVEMDAPMAIRQAPLPDDAGLAALLYGPNVLVADLGPTEEPADRVYGRYGPGREKPVPAPALVFPSAEAMEESARWITPEAEKQPLVFRTHGVGRPQEARLLAFHRLHHRYYAVYLRRFLEAGYEAFLQEQAAQASRRATREERLVDAVRLGDAESMRAHQFAYDKKTEGVYQDRNWVQAEDGGCLEWSMQFPTDVPGVLTLTYWGADAGDRRFRILVEGREIAQQALTSLSPGQFVEVDYEVPLSMTQGRSALPVRLEPLPGNVAGAVFGVATYRKEG